MHMFIYTHVNTHANTYLCATKYNNPNSKFDYLQNCITKVVVGEEEWDRKERERREEEREKEEATQLEQFKALNSKNNTIYKPGHVNVGIFGEVSSLRKRKRTFDYLT